MLFHTRAEEELEEKQRRTIAGLNYPPLPFAFRVEHDRLA
jgi:hypothetical protein